uniref:Fibronectin type-III domain-containing protein n=1 Tax=Steinernema glaseri TaxID=37863 RepID=A0A1I7ZCI9_9BILA
MSPPLSGATCDSHCGLRSMTLEHVTTAFLRRRVGEILAGWRLAFHRAGPRAAQPAAATNNVPSAAARSSSDVTNNSRIRGPRLLFAHDPKPGIFCGTCAFTTPSLQYPCLVVLLVRVSVVTSELTSKDPDITGAEEVREAIWILNSARGDGRRAMTSTSTVPPTIAAAVVTTTSSVPQASEMHHNPPPLQSQSVVFSPPPVVYVARPPPSSVAVAKPPDSDCGSSSGLGGMAKNDGSSEPSSSVNSELSTGAKQRPLALPLGAPTIAVSGPSGPPGAPRSFYTMTCDANGVPACSSASYFDQVTRLFPQAGGAAPPYVSVPAGFEGNATLHDLFLHIHSGESLSLMVGSELQMISGPATIRMVGMAGLSPQALNISMPEGHVLQQVVDPDGVLRHMILSPQSVVPPTATGPIPNAAQQNVPMNGKPFPSNHFPSPSQSPPMPTPYPVVHNGGYELVDLSEPKQIGPKKLEPLADNHYSARRYTMPQRKASEEKVPVLLTNGDDISASGTPISDHADDNETTRSSESEDNDKLKERLCGLSPPKLSFVSSREARLCWEGLDTSEASSSGGPFPHIDASEFTYDVSLFEVLGQSRVCVSNFKLQSNGGNNQLTLRGLNPGREYCVTCRANLLERGLYGEPTAPLVFRTQSSVPDPPMNIRLIHRGPTWFTLSWGPAIDNGLPIRSYTIHVLK